MIDPYQRSLDHVYKGIIKIPQNLVRFRITGGIKPYVSAIKPGNIARKIAYWHSQGLTAVPLDDHPAIAAQLKKLRSIKPLKAAPITKEEPIFEEVELVEDLDEEME